MYLKCFKHFNNLLTYLLANWPIFAPKGLLSWMLLLYQIIITITCWHQLFQITSLFNQFTSLLALNCSCPNLFWNVLQVWMTGKDVYLQMTWSWPDKTWNILCSYCLQWNTSQSKFRNHYFLFLFAFSILSQLFLIWGCMKILWTSASNSHQSFYGRNWHCYRMIVTVNVRLFFCDTVKPLVCRHYIIKVQTLLNIMYSKCLLCSRFYRLR